MRRVQRFAVCEAGYFSTLQGLEMGWRELGAGGRTHKTKLSRRILCFFVIEKYVEGVKQDEKHVSDLLEATMRPPGLANEELRPILFKMTQFGSNTSKSR